MSYAVNIQDGAQTTSCNFYQPPTYGQLYGRRVKDGPASHDRVQLVTTGSGVSLFGILLIVGIILWTVGSFQMNPSMVLTGQILFGLAFLPVLVLAACRILFPTGHTVAVKV